MPCYEVRTMSVEFKAESAGMLHRAMVSLQWKYLWTGNTVQFENGIILDLDKQRAIIPRGQQSKLNELKRAYSMECLKQVAVRNRWQITKKTGTKGSFTKVY
jgi:hypothetical protein